MSGENWTPGRKSAPKGTREWADAVRLRLSAMIDHLGEDSEEFIRCIEVLQELRAWSLLTKRDGSTFRSREEFCAYARPWGLARPWAELRPYVVAGLAKRGMKMDEIDRHLALDGVPEAMPVAESSAAAVAAHIEKAAEITTAHREPSLHTGLFALAAERAAESDHAERAELAPSDATLKRLRAINRAPEAVREAFKGGRISETLAAKLGPKDPSPEQAARVADIARAIVDEPDRKRVDAVVRERLGIEPPPMVRLDNDPGRAASLLLQRFGGQWSRDLVIALDALCQQVGK